MISVDNILEIEKHLDGIEAVIFDLDDTLYSEKEYVRSGYREIAKYFPQIEKMEEKLWDAFEGNKQAINEVLLNEGALTEQNLAESVRIYRYHMPDIHLYVGVEELLKRIHSHGKKIGLITDGRPEGQRAKIAALKLGELIDEIIVTDEIGGVKYRKPHEKSFKLMQRKLKAPFENMVYIGDNPRKDFEAPEILGMRSIWFRNRDGIYYIDD